MLGCPCEWELHGLRIVVLMDDDVSHSGEYSDKIVPTYGGEKIQHCDLSRTDMAGSGFVWFYYPGLLMLYSDCNHCGVSNRKLSVRPIVSPLNSTAEVRKNEVIT